MRKVLHPHRFCTPERFKTCTALKHNRRCPNVCRERGNRALVIVQKSRQFLRLHDAFKIGFWKPQNLALFLEHYYHRQGCVQHVDQRRKRHIKIREILRTPAGCPWDGGTNRGVPTGVPGISCCLLLKNWHFCRDTGRVSQGHPAVQGLFRNFM